MDADEWVRWKAYSLIHPINDEATQILLASILSYIHNYLTDPKDTERRSPSDFLPYLGTRIATLAEVRDGRIRVAPHLRARLDGAE